ncbi:MAG: GtrA family protein [Rhodomicrobium sp.]|nr:GtrA family protein [Rhodomicrobium sp.]
MFKLDLVTLKFFMASVAALLTDMALALALYQLTPLTLTACSVIAYITVGAVFYFVHEYITFMRPGSSRNGRRFLANISVLGLAFLSRISTIALLETIHKPDGLMAAAYILAGAGISFTINYALNRHWVFKH